MFAQGRRCQPNKEGLEIKRLINLPLAKELSKRIGERWLFFCTSYFVLRDDKTEKIYDTVIRERNAPPQGKEQAVLFWADWQRWKYTVRTESDFETALKRWLASLKDY